MCNVDADCARVFKGCYCGARSVLAVNKKYAWQRQLCEDDAETRCGVDCDRDGTYAATQGGGTTLDPDAIVARCDQLGIVGVCVTRIE